MSTTESTDRTCRHCHKPLVRNLVNRTTRAADLEPLGVFERRQYCDRDCWYAERRSGRPPRPVCACGCGALTPWAGSAWQQYAIGCYTAPKQKPRHTRWVDDGSGFWDWLAGFLDGEGFFGFIPRTFKRTYHTPVVRISVRLDDRAILDEIAARVGGTVRVQPPYGTSKHQARWGITSMADCLRLIEILDAHPLRAKKARDYATWREAVLEKDREGNTERLDRLAAALIEDRRWNPECLNAEGDA